MVASTGLEWVAGTFGLEPRWTREPNIEIIEVLARKHLKLEQRALCRVTFYAQGAFNKLFKVVTDTVCFVMRVALPIDPANKTNSEVATIQFLHQYTGIPVAKIFAFDASQENELGFEWILMEMLPGSTLRSRWRKLSIGVKKDLVRQIAHYQAQLSQHKFHAIGNMFMPRTSDVTPEIQASANEGQSKKSSPSIGRMVSLIFFWGDHASHDVWRGPFTRAEDWIRARLTLVLTGQETILKTSDDEDDIEEAEIALGIAKRLLKLLPSIFIADAGHIQPTMLFHDDLSMQNILVDDHGKITGLIDWECVSAVPLWKACRLPEFLQGRDRNEEPQRDAYGEDTDQEEGPSEGEEDALDNEGVTDLYWMHLLEYELTMLRTLFLEEMGSLDQQWITESQKGADKADFDVAVQNCDNSWLNKQVKSWLDALDKGEAWNLEKCLRE